MVDDEKAHLYYTQSSIWFISSEHYNNILRISDVKLIKRNLVRPEMRASEGQEFEMKVEYSSKTNVRLYFSYGRKYIFRVVLSRFNSLLHLYN